MWIIIFALFVTLIGDALDILRAVIGTWPTLVVSAIIGFGAAHEFDKRYSVERKSRH